MVQFQLAAALSACLGLFLLYGHGVHSYDDGQTAPAWQISIEDELHKACNRDQCFPGSFPDVNAISSHLATGCEQGSEEVAMATVEVVHQFLRWSGPSLTRVLELLQPGRPWTKAYCEHLTDSEDISNMVSDWLGHGFEFRVVTLEKKKKANPEYVQWTERWFNEIRKSDDAEAKRLVKNILEQDALAEGKLEFDPSPQYDLDDHLSALVLKHLTTKACASKYQKKQIVKALMQMFPLHAFARYGKTATVRELLRMIPSEERKRYALHSSPDTRHLTVEQSACAHNHSKTALTIRELVGFEIVGEASICQGALQKSSSDSETCDATKSGGSCNDKVRPWMNKPVIEGGWSSRDSGKVPLEWLPPTSSPCFAEVVDAKDLKGNQVESLLSYVRPMLIRGGVQLAKGVRSSYTRKGLAAALKGLILPSNDIPYGDEHADVPATNMSIADYLKFLDDRSTSGMLEDSLRYIFLDVNKDPWRSHFGFALKPFEMLKVVKDYINAVQFYLGSTFMGAPLHYHTVAFNGLVYGRKLWILRPPSERLWSIEPIFKFLNRTGGDPGGLKCLQEEGDILFVPRSWVHGAVCLGDCVGAAFELNTD